jgi:predicted ABC-type ATPase
LIAQGLSPFDPERAAFRAGRLMLGEIEALAERHEDFGFETTLSGKGNLQVVRGLKERGYEVHIFYLWVPSAELTLERIKERVLRGGHDVAETVVRRRFEKSMRNFFGPYRALADGWMLFDNSGAGLSIVASEEKGSLRILQSAQYNELVLLYGTP